MYTDPDSRNTLRYLQSDGRTDRETDRQTDDIMMSIANPTV